MNRNQTASRIRIHELATELDASPDEILGFLREQGEKVRDRSTVIGLSVARTVRKRFGVQPTPPTVGTPPLQFSAPAEPMPAQVAASPGAIPQFLPGSSPFLAPVPVPTAVPDESATGPAARAGAASDVVPTAEDAPEPPFELLLVGARTEGFPAGGRRATEDSFRRYAELVEQSLGSRPGVQPRVEHGARFGSNNRGINQWCDTARVDADGRGTHSRRTHARTRREMATERHGRRRPGCLDGGRTESGRLGSGRPMHGHGHRTRRPALEIGRTYCLATPSRR